MFEHKIFEGMVSSYTTELSLTHFAMAGELDYLLTTPQIMEVVIQASAKMLDPALPEPYITLGTHIEFYHEQPTLIMAGGSIRVELKVTQVDGNRIVLAVTCFDKDGQIGHGIYERAIVDKERFRFSTYTRAGQPLKTIR